MEGRNKFSLKNVDKPLLFIFIAMVFMGWLNIYSAVYDEAHHSIFDLSQRYGKQMLFIAFSFLIALFVLLVDLRIFTQLAYFYYGAAILLLCAVLLVGTEISGAKAWIQIAGFSVQPSEFAKFATCLAFARYLSMTNIPLGLLKNQFKAAFFFVLPIVLILLQPDAGSAMVFLSFIFVMYREGMPAKILLIGGLAVLLFVLALLINKYILIGFVAACLLALVLKNKKSFKNIIASVLILLSCSVYILSVDYMFQRMDDHQKARINVLLGKDSDLKGAGYNVNQSKIAIGSGGFLGKGYLQGTQTKFNFVPEQSTDFIFCTIGEEWGFLGSSLVLALFFIMIVRIIRLSERQRSSYGRIYGYGLASILFFHCFVNIGMTIGLLPVIGIPLPFFSYGGSSLWSFTLMYFLFLKMDAKRVSL